MKKKKTPSKPKKKINSKKKGSAGELELAHLFKAYGYTARRTEQYCGNSGDAADVLIDELPEAHLEVKRTETLSIYKVMEQVVRDNKDKKPLELIFHRRNHQNWVCILPEDSFFRLLNGYKIAQDIEDIVKLTTAQRSQLAARKNKPLKVEVKEAAPIELTEVVNEAPAVEPVDDLFDLSSDPSMNIKVDEDEST